MIENLVQTYEFGCRRVTERRQGERGGEGHVNESSPLMFVPGFLLMAHMLSPDLSPGASDALSAWKCFDTLLYCTPGRSFHQPRCAVHTEHVTFDRFITRLRALFSAALWNPVAFLIAGVMFMHEERLFDWAIVASTAGRSTASIIKQG